MTTPLALYIHWPFCLSKCPYCDFNSHVRETVDAQRWQNALLRELDYYADQLAERTITSIFFGGGTPSLMPPALVAALIDRVGQRWKVASDLEITLEANPTSVEAEKFRAFRAAGVNRVSLGIQSLRDADLKFLGREHDARQARAAITLAAKTFPRYSFDLIYARHGQTAASWAVELREALTLAGDHLSLYQLTLEPGTQFFTRANRGEAMAADPAAAAAMFEETQMMMAAAGMPAYEISNHARAGHASRHNLAYWHYDDYVGIGPGAHGRFVLDDVRCATETHRVPEVWLDHTEQHGHGLRLCDAIDDATAQREALLMGLRLTQGVDAAAWQKKFGRALADFLPAHKLMRLQDEGLLLASPTNIRATAAGLQRLNSVLEFLLSA
jgi:putative oxygen-independent coproporphyrinogen III oxidase